MRTHQVRLLSVTIEAPFAAAYAFACQPENFMKWAAGLAQTLHRRGEGWVASTPEGEAEVVFSPPNDFGVLDHWVRLPNKPEIYIPLRIIANGEGVEVELTLLRQPDMTDEMFERDAEMVTRDLAKLKAVLEARA